MNLSRRGPSPVRRLVAWRPLFILWILGISLHTSAYSLRYAFSLKRRDEGYFTRESVLPPLKPLHTDGDPSTRDRRFSSPLPVTYTNDPRSVHRWCRDNIPDGPAILGFDVESVPNAWWMNRTKFHGPATVQLATIEACLVVHLAHRNGNPSGECGPVLSEVLMNDMIVKCGCAIDDDLLELASPSSIKIRGASSRLDLGLLREGKNRLGLKTLTRMVLNLDLIKSRSVSMSNWSRVPLTRSQIAYSARDAWAGAAVLTELACQDPQTFGPAALVNRLQSSELPLDQMRRQLKVKRLAKKRLSKVGRMFHDGVAPRSLKNEMSYLRKVLRQNEVKRQEWDLSNVELGALLGTMKEKQGFNDTYV